MQAEPAPLSPPPRTNPLYSLSGVLAFAVVIVSWQLTVLLEFPASLSFGEASLWLRSRSLGEAGTSWPPLAAWGIAATTALCGHGETCARLWSPLASSGAAIVLYFLGRDLYGPRVGFLAAITLMTLPTVFVSALSISRAPSVLLAWCVGLAVAWRGLRAVSAPEWGGWLAAVLLTVAAKGWELAALQEFGGNFEAVVRLLAWQGLAFGPLLLVGLIRLLGTLRSFPPDPTTRFLLIFTVVPAAGVLFGELAGIPGDPVTAMVPAYGGAILLVVARETAGGRAWLLRTSLGLHLLMAGLFFYGENLPEINALGLSRTRFERWEILARQVGRIWATQPGTMLLFDDPDLRAELTYYLTPQSPGTGTPPATALWADASPQPGRSYLLATRAADVAPLARAFEHTEMLVVLRVPVKPEAYREIRLFRLYRYKGSPP
ncbi:MAG: ArnT family glycosyltransferase [Alphaproteobacteria bacterium]